MLMTSKITGIPDTIAEFRVLAWSCALWVCHTTFLSCSLVFFDLQMVWNASCCVCDILGLLK